MFPIKGLLKFMLSLSVASLIVSIVASAEKGAPSAAVVSNGDENSKGPDGGSSCRKLIMILAKRMMKVLTVCTKAVKAQFPGEAFMEHFQCAIKCFMNKVEMVTNDNTDENHKASNETFAVFAVKYIPEEYHSLLDGILGPCLDTWGPNLDPNDEKCTSYGEIIKCLQERASQKC